MLRALRVNPSHEHTQFIKHYRDYEEALRGGDLARAAHSGLAANFYLGLLRGMGDSLKQEGIALMDLDEELVVALQRRK